MRILLDSRDLINLLERDRPITAAAYAEFLRTHGHLNVLSATNVREFASPLATGREFMEIRGFLQALDAFPHECIKEAAIPGDELASAVRCFERGIEYEPAGVFVRRWDFTLLLPPGQVRGATDNWIGLRLDEIVHMINRAAGLRCTASSQGHASENDRG